jgi:arylsulfatase A-like enzyme
MMVLVLCSACSRTSSLPDKPNVVYIQVDDLGWMDTATFGSTYYETPNLDILAAEGMLFTRGYAGAANCAPSRACLMSGQNTPRHGVYTVGSSERGKSSWRKLIPTTNITELADEVYTVAELFRDAGYATGTFGKWHLGSDPITQGFDVNVGGDDRGNPGRDGYFSPYNVPHLENAPIGENLTDRLTSEALQFMEQHQETPFFVYLSYYAVHTPLATTPELRDKYEEKRGDTLQNHAVYAGMVETVDRNVGRILETINELKLDNTLVVFTSDNGGIRAVSSQHPLRAGKGSYYEGGIRVPYVMHWKEVIPEGAKSEVPITNLDFFPTVMDMLNTELPEKELDGRSWLPIWKGEPVKERSMYFHFPIYLEGYRGKLDDARDSLFRTRPGSVIIDGDWKLHEYFEDGGVELYDLVNDPGERQNLADSLTGKRDALLRQLNTWRLETGAPVPKRQNPEYLFEQ